jgi:signal transduction histidine kinase
MNIKSKLIISYIILIIFSVSILGFLINKKSQDAVFREVTEKSESIAELINTTASVRNDLLSERILTDLNFSDKYLNSLGKLHIKEDEQMKVGSYSLPTLYAGTNKLNLNTNIINEMQISAESIVSIFLLKNNHLIRISTNVTADGKLATGTCIANTSDVYKKIANNESYFGRFLFDNSWYMTAYKPLLDKNNRVIGALGLGYTNMNSYLKKTLSSIKVGKTGYVYIMDSNGSVILHPDVKVSNIGNYDFSKKIIRTKNGVIEYELNGIYKLAAYRYFEPWDWYIVTTANYDDLKSSSFEILKTSLITALIIFILGSILAVFMANTLVKPINKLKNYMEIASKGDLSVHSDISSKDEIGILSNSFNTMIRENKRLLDEIVKYDRVKTEFFANISHELRTPLNIIFSTAQLFSLYADTDSKEMNIIKINKYTHTMKQNCYRLLRLVNNLIDITKIDSGFMELNLKNVNIIEIVENITLSTAEYIESNSRTIIFDTDIEEKIMAIDPEQMERVILNLISNATKFTSPGDTIEVTIYDKDKYILISVKDTGIGIPQDKLDSIFERFKQVDPLLSRRSEGSGIGLSLVKSLVEMHNGAISVKSKCDVGTEFLLEFPVSLIDENINIDVVDDLSKQSNVEKIRIEFSDIYS